MSAILLSVLTPVMKVNVALLVFSQCDPVQDPGGDAAGGAVLGAPVRRAGRQLPPPGGA